MIGNDIIDLQLAEKESNWQRKGFLEKQFTEGERALIKKSKEPFKTVWRMWSMKEAAYKIWSRKNQKRAFNPKKFQCDFNSASEGMVMYEDETIYTSSRIDGYYIFTLASLDKKTKTSSWIGPPYRIEEYLKKTLEKETGISALEIEKKKSKTGAPNFYHNKKQLTKSCSISHHGNYGAFSFLLA